MEALPHPRAGVTPGVAAAGPLPMRAVAAPWPAAPTTPALIGDYRLPRLRRHRLALPGIGGPAVAALVSLALAPRRAPFPVS